MKVFAIRGAITASENSERAISEASIKLIEEVIDQNNLRISDVISIIISSTLICFSSRLLMLVT